MLPITEHENVNVYLEPDTSIIEQEHVNNLKNTFSIIE